MTNDSDPFDRDILTTSDGRYVATYCTPKDVMRRLRFVAYSDEFDQEIHEPSDADLTTYDEMIFLIEDAENSIDALVGVTWKPKRIVKHIMTVNEYWHDINGIRMEYWQNGGYWVQLNPDICEWDPNLGDKVEIRTPGNQWVDITRMTVADPEDPDGTNNRFWFDYERGILFLRTPYYSMKNNAIRITYRYGRQEPVPADISMATSLKVAIHLLNSEMYDTRIGQGGDLGSQKQNYVKYMNDKINEIVANRREFTPVISLYG